MAPWGLQRKTYESHFPPGWTFRTSRLHKWLVAPHVAVWWNEPFDLVSLEARYGPRIDGSEPIHVYLTQFEGAPIGWIQWYRWRDFPEHAIQLGADYGSAGIDLAIGEFKMTGRGLGPAVIREFGTNYIFVHRDLDAIIADPSVSNLNSVSAFKKAGSALSTQCSSQRKPLNGTSFAWIVNDRIVLSATLATPLHWSSCGAVPQVELTTWHKPWLALALRASRKLPGFRRYFHFFTLLDKQRNTDLKPRFQRGHLGATSAGRIATYGEFRLGKPSTRQTSAAADQSDCRYTCSLAAECPPPEGPAHSL